MCIAAVVIAAVVIAAVVTASIVLVHKMCDASQLSSVSPEVCLICCVGVWQSCLFNECRFSYPPQYYQHARNMALAEAFPGAFHRHRASSLSTISVRSVCVRVCVRVCVCVSTMD